MNPRYFFNTYTNRATTWIACAMLVVAATGCSQPTEAPAMELAQPQASNNEVEIEALDPRVVVWDRNTLPWGKELLLSTDLASLTESTLRTAWRIYAGYDTKYSIDRENEPPVKVEVLGYDGIVRVAGKGPFSMTQRIQGIPPDPAERWIEAEVWVRAEDPDSVSLSLRHSSAEEEPVQVWHRGGGWQRLHVAGPYLWGTRPGDIEFKIVRRQERARIAISHPSMRIVDTHPSLRAQATGEEGQLLINGNFEMYSGGGVPYPWQMVSWDGEPGMIRLAEVERQGSGSSTVAEMTPGEGSVRLFQFSPLLGADHAGQIVRGAIDANASDSRGMNFRMRTLTADGNKVDDADTTVIHTGDGTWQRLTLELRLPADESVYPVYVSIEAIRRPEDPKSVLVDNASLTIEAE